MKKIVLGFMLICSLVTISCSDDCDPGLLPADDELTLIVLNNNGTAFIKYPTSGSGNDTLPPEVKITNITTATRTPVYNNLLIADSIFIIRDYNRAFGAVTRFEIRKALLKPDTVEVTTGKATLQDACARDFEVARFSRVKANDSLKCTNCLANTAIVVRRK